MPDREQVLELLNKNNFLVNVIVNEEGCKATYPESLSPKIPAKTKQYIIDKDTLTINDETIKCPEYASRLYILTDISKDCIALHYNVCYIKTQHDNGETINGLDEFLIKLREPSSLGQQRKEKLLYSLFKIAYPTKFSDDFLSVSEQNEILEGYKLLQSIFKGESSNE